MGQHNSHHQNARAVKHRRSTRSLPDVANQGRCMTDEDKARWDAYRKGVYNKIQQQAAYNPAPAPVVPSSNDNCVKNEQQNFSSFERSYLAANHQNRPQQAALMSYRKPKSDVGVYGHDAVRAGRAAKTKGDNRCSKKRDDTWLEVASDFCQPSSRRRDDFPASNNARRHQSQPYRQKNGVPTKLDRVPETSYIDEEETNGNCSMLDEEDEISKMSETKSDFIATCNRKSRRNEQCLKSSRSCYTSLKSEDSLENGGRRKNDCDKVIIQSLQRELNAERNLRINLENRTHKDQETMLVLKKQIEKLKSKVERLNKRLDEKDFKSLSNSNEDLKLQRLQELSMENEKLKRENDGLKQNLEKCLENVAAEVARTVVNDKVLKTECIRLQQRVFELEWKQKLNVQGSSNSVICETNGNLDQSKLNTKTPFNSTEKSRSCPVEEDYTEVFDNNSSPYPKIQEHLNVDEQQPQQHSPFSMSGGGGEALCSRPVSLNFDNSGSQANSSLNGNQEIIVNYMQFSTNKALYDVTCSLLADKFCQKFTLDDGYFSTLSSLNGNFKPFYAKKWRSLLDFGNKNVRNSSKNLSFPFLAGNFAPKMDHLQLLKTFLSSRNDLTEFERDSMLQKLEEAAVARESMCDLKEDVRVENNDYVECIEDEKEEKKVVGGRKQLFFKPNASCTSDDSSEYYGEKNLIKERWNQLKRKRNFGKLAVVRYKPNHRRVGTIVPNYGNENCQKLSCLSRNRAFVRFGRQERQALTCFDFLFERRYDDDDETMEKNEPILEHEVVDLSLQQNESIYENLPYHETMIGSLPPSKPDSEDPKSSPSTSASSSPTTARKPAPASSTNVAYNLRQSSSDSSLFLSQWNLAARYMEENDEDEDDIDDDEILTSSNTDRSFTSESSISVNDLM